MTYWSDWSACSATCGVGESIRSRSCQAGCDHFTDDLTQTQECNEKECPGKNFSNFELKDSLIEKISTIKAHNKAVFLSYLGFESTSISKRSNLGRF